MKFSADDPAPATSEGGMDTDIIMINMNMANIQMNMGDFRGSEYAGDGFSYNNTMQFLRPVFLSVTGIKNFISHFQIHSILIG